MVNDRIDRVEYDPDDGTGNCFVAIPKLQEVQISMSKREEELKTNKQIQIKQK